MILLWLQPRMSYAALAFTVFGTLYLIAGSYHQDTRLSRRYGAPYEFYRTAVPLFLPRLR